MFWILFGLHELAKSLPENNHVRTSTPRFRTRNSTQLEFKLFSLRVLERPEAGYIPDDQTTLLRNVRARIQGFPPRQQYTKCENYIGDNKIILTLRTLQNMIGKRLL